jgi:hypothetical protein
MTLLELLVGLTIIGLAVSAGFGALAMLGDRRRAADAAEGRDARAAAVRHELVTWLSDARLEPDEGGPEFRGLDGVRDEQPDDRLALLTTAPTPLGQGNMLVGLFVDRDSATPERGLTASFAAWRGTAVRRVELDPHVAGLDIRYLSASLGRVSWFPSWVTSTLLPSGIEVRLVPAPGDSLPELLRLPILVPLRSGS